MFVTVPASHLFCLSNSKSSNTIKFFISGLYKFFISRGSGTLLAFSHNLHSMLDLSFWCFDKDYRWNIYPHYFCNISFISIFLWRIALNVRDTQRRLTCIVVVKGTCAVCGKTKTSISIIGIDKIWAADLVDMQAFTMYTLKYNKWVKYLSTATDIFSKWMIPLKNKTGTEVAGALQRVFKEGKSQKLWVDKGKAFYNNSLKVKKCLSILPPTLRLPISAILHAVSPAAIPT